MIITMKNGATEDEIRKVIGQAKAMGLGADVSAGAEKTIIGIVGSTAGLSEDDFKNGGVENVARVSTKYKLASRDFRKEDTVVEIRQAKAGGGNKLMIAGPCAVESLEQIMDAAAIVKDAGCDVLRGGAFKPRESPHDWQGLGEKGLELLALAGERHSLPIVTEIISESQIPLFEKYNVDIYQIGMVNAVNAHLVREVAKTKKPMLLKRAPWADVGRFICIAEYALVDGNYNVMPCVRGTIPVATKLRYQPDVTEIPELKRRTHLPIICDPSHMCGDAKLVPSICRMAMELGADGLEIEMHPNPKNALTDRNQQLAPAELYKIMKEIRG